MSCQHCVEWLLYQVSCIIACIGAIWGVFIIYMFEIPGSTKKSAERQGVPLHVSEVNVYTSTSASYIRRRGAKKRMLLCL